MAQVKVLIVDDDENNRELLRDVLEDDPYTLLEAEDGQSALAVVDRETPDLILLDVMMPGLDGMAVLGRLQSQDHTRHIPVMMVTALGKDSNVSECLEAGAVDHIAKPFSPLVVRARVRAAIRDRVQSKRGKLIGFIGSKGGVGNTTAVVNTALALATPERRVAAVELRPYFGTLANQVGITPQRSLQSLLDDPQLGSIPRNLDKSLTSHPSGLKLLFAPPTIDDEREITADQSKAILKSLAESADCVLVDLPFPPSAATRAALEVCDFVVLTIALETSCIASARSLLETLASWGMEEGRLGALMLIHYASIESIAVADVRKQLTCRIIGVVPPSVEQFLAASRASIPLMLTAPRSVAAEAFTELSSKLLKDHVQALAF